MTNHWKPCPLCGAALQSEEAGFEHPYSVTCPLDSIYIDESQREAWNSRAADQTHIDALHTTTSRAVVKGGA